MKKFFLVPILLLSGCLCPEKAAIPALKSAFALMSNEYGTYVQKDPGLSTEAKTIKMRTVEKVNSLFAELEKSGVK